MKWYRREKERDKIRQDFSMLAYQQVEARRQEQLATSKELLEMQFEAAFEGQGADFGSQPCKASFIVQAENPALKAFQNMRQLWL